VIPNYTSTNIRLYTTGLMLDLFTPLAFSMELLMLFVNTYVENG